ncbi:MAG: DNA mismatch repair protein MutS [Defluviitaleaceae bacterium]|nr:DNA mismatch repair protein MutS [Defluviitaleaceae bacterium]MCL2836187.1 DNA mismatch repair protein MutS [Defluviitaleaceae bacterium]
MNHLTTLEFDKILEKLAHCAVSETVKERCLTLNPAKSLPKAERRQCETTQAKQIIEQTGTPPLAAMTDLQKIIGLLGADAMLIPEQLAHVMAFITSCRRMVTYMQKARFTDVDVAFYGGSFIDLSHVEDEINRCIRGIQVDDRASQRLYDLRRGIEIKGEQIKAKLDQMLRKNRDCFSEGFVAVRNGRYTLPVKREFKSRIEGVMVELSNTGGTCFIEPASVRKLQDELGELHIEEDNEVRRILYTLTALVHDFLPSIRVNIDAMETLDFLFAKAKLSMDMKASPVRLIEGREMRILSARHPLLREEIAVPLDFALGGDWTGVAITGPNTGGKTVALKTVGLLSLMAQSGLHIPANDKSIICMFDAVLCDVGDGQSITENLSTFSSHMTNIIGILRASTENSLVLLDELGSGTDPAEGMGIAMAILEALLVKRCLFTVTTHYPEIKDFSAYTDGLINARMAFDKESLMPLYRLEIGEAGESCALYIAERLGMPVDLLNRAREITYAGAHSAPLRMPPAMERLIPVVPLELAEEAAEPVPVPRSQRFNIGDSVTVYPQKEIGIVYARANEKGEVGVQVKGRKRLVNHKRIKLKIAASELYPDDYDMSIVFDSVENRKAWRLMDKKHVEGNVAVIKKGVNER